MSNIIERMGVMRRITSFLSDKNKENMMLMSRPLQNTDLFTIYQPFTYHCALTGVSISTDNICDIYHYYKLNHPAYIFNSKMSDLKMFRTYEHFVILQTGRVLGVGFNGVGSINMSSNDLIMENNQPRMEFGFTRVTSSLIKEISIRHGEFYGKSI